MNQPEPDPPSALPELEPAHRTHVEPGSMQTIAVRKHRWLPVVLILAAAAGSCFWIYSKMTSSSKLEAQNATTSLTQDCEAEYQQSVSALRAEYNFDAGYNLAENKGCQDLNGDGRPEVILTAGGLAARVLSPTYLVYTRDAGQMKMVLDATAATDFDVVPDKTDGWSNLWITLPDDNGNPGKQVSYVWNGQGYDLSAASEQELLNASDSPVEKTETIEQNQQVVEPESVPESSGARSITTCSEWLDADPAARMEKAESLSTMFEGDASVIAPQVESCLSNAITPSVAGRGTGLVYLAKICGKTLGYDLR